MCVVCVCVCMCVICMCAVSVRVCEYGCIASSQAYPIFSVLGFVLDDAEGGIIIIVNANRRTERTGWAWERG